MIDLITRLAGLCLPLLLAAGCGTTPATHYYMLDPAVQAVAGRGLPDGRAPSIGIAPVDFPAYLDRPQIVTRGGGAEIHLSDIHRWAEPLRDNFTRVLAANLSRLLGTDRVGIEPSRLRAEPDYRLAVEVRQFDAGRDGEIALVAYWSLRDRDGAVRVDMRKTEIRLTADRPGYDELAGTLSAAVARLSLEIAAAVRDLPPS